MIDLDAPANRLPQHRLLVQIIVLSAAVATSPIGIARAIAGGAYVRRFALIVSAHDGGKGREKLRYAHADAKAVADVLTQLGGLTQGDLVTLQDPAVEQVQQGLLGLRELIKQAARVGKTGTRVQRIEFIFYYSGHSDEQGLLLAGRRLSYKQIREALGQIAADVRIAVLDSCSSGALTRVKGGRHQPPFLIDRSTDVRGHAFLTSASGTESAQESDRLQGSFFTHYLVSGLRGAADANKDRRITLSEAYNYAYHETLARTEATRAGPQHASYAMNLVGSGEVVLTDLRASSAVLLLDEAIDGRLFLRDAKSSLVAELRKRRGQPLRLSLVPGSYELRLQREKAVYAARVTLALGAVTHVAPAMLSLRTARTFEGAKKGRIGRMRRPFAATAIPGVSTNPAGPVTNNVAVHIWGSGDALYGVDLALAGVVRSGPTRGMQLSMLFNSASADFAGAQIALGLNLLGSGSGAQIGFGLNYGRALRGAQLGNVNLLTRSSSGAQLGMVSIATDRFSGLQAGMLCWSGPLAGVQLAMAGVVGDVAGAQLGMVNVAHGRVSGVQVGMVNVAAKKTRGVQLGLVNYAGRADGLVPIGLINIVKEGGILDPTFFASGGAMGNLVFKMGTPYFYSMFGIGAHDDPEDGTMPYLIGGLGTHIRLGKRPYLEVEALLNWGFKQGLLGSPFGGGDELDAMVQLRVPMGIRITSWLSVFAGPTLDYLISDRRKSAGAAGVLWQVNDANTNRHQHLAVGFTTGLQFTSRGW